VKVRTGLFFLVAGAVVPVLLLALVLGLMLIDHDRDTFRRNTEDRARTFLLVVDAAIQGHLSTLKALSTSSNLATGNVTAFQRRLGRILDSQPEWEDVILSGPDGHHVADAAYPDDVGGPDPDVDALLQAAKSGKSTVGSIVARGPARKFGVAIHFPVLRGQGVAYVVSAIVRPAQFQSLIEAQRLPPRWTSGLVDRHFHYVARVPPRGPTAEISKAFREAMERSPEGWYRAPTADGIDAYTAYARSPLSGWTIGVAIPAAEANAAWQRGAWALGIGTVVAMALAVVFAFVAGRRIAVPMGQLAAGARNLALAEGVPVAPRRLPFREMRDVEHALNESAQSIAERHALREREQAALREADRAKDEFIAVLGHELRNPLSAIASSVKLLQVVPEGSDAAVGAREIIARQTKQMTRLVEDLMDISRLATGKLTLKRDRLDLSELAHRLVDTWARSKRIAGDRVRLDLEPAWVEADRARLEQVLANLLDNASKFSPEASPIEVRVRARGDEAILEVRDFGSGMDAPMIAQAFKPFVQGPQDAHRPTGGLGLGLSVVRRLVELHGGRVEAVSGGPGRGTTFTVTLPLAPAQPL
jgi:signal transduction histidine kinase